MVPPANDSIAALKRDLETTKAQLVSARVPPSQTPTPAIVAATTPAVSAERRAPPSLAAGPAAPLVSSSSARGTEPAVAPATRTVSTLAPTPVVHNVPLPGSRPTPTRPGAVAPVAPKPVAPPPAPPRQHVIVAGDTLSKIALRYYGSATRWPEILAANHDVLRDERTLTVGRTLRIP